MKFWLLGKVAAVLEKNSPPLRLRPQVTAFLAVLLLSPDFTADLATIRGYLWPGSRERLDNNIQQCVRMLRAALGYDTVRRVGPGTYCLVVQPEEVDLHRFQELLKTARGAVGAERATQLLQSMDLWSGPPLANIDGVGFDGVRGELVEMWKSACVDYITAECEVDAIANIETNLPRLIKPWSGERYSGLVAEIKEAYARQLANRNQVVAGSAGQMAPRQLPAHRTSIVGRDTQLRLIDDALLQSGGPRICVLTGPAGVGKSLAALRWAETREEYFPGGTLYVDLNGFSTHKPAEPEQVLIRFLNDLEVKIPRAKDGLSTAFRTALAGRAVLVVLDNARDVHQVRPMLPGPGPSAAIVTSRNQLAGLRAVVGASVFDVPRLNADECAVLLASVIGRARMEAEPDSARELLRHCAGLPLAVVVLGSRIAARNVLTLAHIVAELRSAVHRLSSFSHDEAELNVRGVFESALAQLSPRATELFWKLGVHRGPSISRVAVGVLSALAESDSQDALAELRSAHMIEEVSYERYAMHDLLRDFAEERAAAESAAERRVVVERILDHLLHNARACDRVISPVREVATGGVPSGIPIVAPESPQAAMAWLDAEYDVITAAVDQAESLGLDRYTWLLPVVISTYQRRRGHYLDAGRMLEKAFQAAERVANPGDMAMVLRMRARADEGLKRLDHAKIRLADAIALCDHGADPLGYAHSSNALAVVHRENGEPDLAESRFRDALAIYRDHGDAAGAAVSLNGIGCTFWDRGDVDKALAFCEEALEVSMASTDENGRANVFDSLGDIKLARGEPEVAVDYYQSVVEIFCRLDYKQNEARALCRLADGFAAMGDAARARLALTRAVKLFEELSDPAAREVAERLRALE
ncbi:AfsR/SARP family transcriptional regulator [Goodfellowiella coeruleoviolacea]|uniref:NB-ARC domain-containing protein n=1 Tax=Goodfellowiella coeruleoviolacea TaxID=334858 RepID=A0AAE3KGB9_9PSEU|nr:tetratricopeptide repeat protein [Goodfellowiella coeruleoviolacea]MCP2167121.1 NB-ARC domain-containing protein [Goodfellowiella coeruleoviolacea]